MIPSKFNVFKHTILTAIENLGLEPKSINADKCIDETFSLNTVDSNCLGKVHRIHIYLYVSINGEFENYAHFVALLCQTEKWKKNLNISMHMNLNVKAPCSSVSWALRKWKERKEEEK